ncbi:MAG: hypothetical protein A2666_01265 [Parcubacteria group bacterium RIFCSPHIGHO2_01_FULL_47_10b]|nr:MAG: hypothetical protein A2666_01265 [Parcubacteria group bacterium RIFCSPHIGHO2_01_FULL_47_10b]
MQLNLSYLNINAWQGGRVLMRELIAFLRAQSADIIALQEVYDGDGIRLPRHYAFLSILRRELEPRGYAYCAFAPAFAMQSPYGPIPQGNAVLSRYPLTPQETIFYDVPFDPFYQCPDDPECTKGDFSRLPRNLQHVIVDVKGTLVHAFNTQGIWGTDGNDNKRRLKQSKIICDAIAEQPHVILSGDFNVAESTESIAMLQQALHDPFQSKRTTSFNMRHKPAGSGFSTAVIDFVMVSRDFEVTHYEQPEINVSDHLPQRVELAFES